MDNHEVHRENNTSIHTYLFPCKAALGLHHQLFGWDKSARTAEKCNDCLTVKTGFVSPKSLLWSKGRGLSNHHPPQSHKPSTLGMLFVFPLDFLGLVLCSVNEIAKRNGFVWCNLRLPPHISHLWMQEAMEFLVTPAVPSSTVFAHWR